MNSCKSNLKKHGWKVGCCLGALGVLAVAAIDRRVGTYGRDRIWRRAKHLPAREVALVLGVNPATSYYLPRLRGAAQLFLDGKVRGIIVSGDHSRWDYDEPSHMKEDLVRLGVPAKYITCDDAGFNTLDSVVRAKEVFGQTNVVIVSQDFHVHRALYIADAYGYHPIALAVPTPDAYEYSRTRLREVAARVKAFLDVRLFHRQPKFLGHREQVAKRPAGGNQPAHSPL